ncbi:MAG: spore coat protein CotJB [Lachnospiraceae bacterium]|nr:spore coat protein CotJB [Lachnospiraceae bacterium]
MKNANYSQEQLLQWIDQISFTCFDMALYLDTHPEDAKAQSFYNEKLRLRKEALEEYARCYGPLTLDYVREDNAWAWVLQPWPWEAKARRCC